MKTIKKKLIVCFSLLVSIILLCSVVPMTGFGNTILKNIAPLSTVKAECPSWAIASLGPAKVVDSNKSSFTTSAYSKEQYTLKELYLVFDKTYSVGQIKLCPRILNGKACAFPVNFVVSLFDGNNWCVVRQCTDTSVSADFEVNVESIEATALRITATKLGEADNGEFAFQLAEIEVNATDVNSMLDLPEIVEESENVAVTSNIKSECPSWAIASLAPEKMIDGNINTFSTTSYVKEEKTEKDIILLFDKAYNISGATLFPRLTSGAYAGGFPKNFSISVWNGSSWETVYEKNGYSSGKDELFTPLRTVDVSAIRISATTLSQCDGGDEYALQLSEINVFGHASGSDIKSPEILEGAQNIAPSADVKAECPDWAMASLSPAKLTDGNTQSGFYTSSYTDNENTTKDIYFTFSKAYKTNSIEIYPRLDGDGNYAGGFPRNLTIYAWTSYGWNSIYSVVDYNSGSNKLTANFDAIDCRGIHLKAEKLDVIKNENQYALQLAEVKINGVLSDAIIDSPNITVTLNDIAHSAQITASCPQWAEKAGYNVSKLNNGIKSYGDFYTSEYSTDSKFSQSIYLSFDKTYNLSNVYLYPRVDKNGEYAGGFPEDFTISAWNGSEWLDVAGKTNYSSTNGSCKLDLNSVCCSGIRITASKLSKVDGESKFALQLSEIEISGSVASKNLSKPVITASENIALSAEVTAESPAWAQKSGYNAEKLHDDVIGKANSGNFYTSTYEKTDSQEKELDFVFDSAYSVQKVVLFPRVDKNGNYVGGFPKTVVVKAWTGSDWKTVANVSDLVVNTDGLELKIDNIECRGIQIIATRLGESENSGEFALQLSEVQIIGKASSLNISKPVINSEKTDKTDDGKNENSSGDSGNNGNNDGVALFSDVEAECPAWALNNLGPEKLVDGNVTNFYTSTYVGTPKKEKIVCLTFENTAIVSQINIYPRIKDGKYVGGFPENFTVSVWNGNKWIKVADETGYKSGNKPYSIPVAGLTINGILIEATKLSYTDDNSQFALQLAEIEAVGTKVDTVLNKPKIVTEESKKITIDGSKNIALNCPAVATSDLAKYHGGVANINDGITGTFWASNCDEYTNGKTESVTINLLDNYMINTVVLAAREKAWGFPYDFTISILYDDKWTDVKTINNFEADETSGITMYEFKFTPTLGNKIRVSSNRFRKAGSDDSMCINEFAVYGTRAIGNYKLPNENVISTAVTITTTSSMEDYGFYLNHLNDSDLETEWSSKPYARANEQQVIEVDLKKDILIGEIQLKPNWGGNGFPSNFTISVYENGKWTDVYTSANYDKPINEAIQRFPFEQKRISKFKITVDEMRQEGGVYVVKLNEILAFPNATDDSYDLNAIKDIKTENKYSPAEIVSNESTDKSGLSKNELIQLIIGAVFVVVAIAGSLLLIRKTARG